MPISPVIAGSRHFYCQLSAYQRGKLATMLKTRAGDLIGNVPDGGLRLLRREEVSLKTGLGRSAIYERMQLGTFPKAVVLSRKAVAWVSAEVDRWIADKIAERDAKNGEGR
jgi:prophage regulatory protein